MTEIATLYKLNLACMKFGVDSVVEFFLNISTNMILNLLFNAGDIAVQHHAPSLLGDHYPVASILANCVDPYAKANWRSGDTFFFFFLFRDYIFFFLTCDIRMESHIISRDL